MKVRPDGVPCISDATLKYCLSDMFWKAVEPFVIELEDSRPRKPRKGHSAGRKPIPARRVLEAILFVARHQLRWKDLPKEHFGSPSAIHSYYLSWAKCGLFQYLWDLGLANTREMEGVLWVWKARRDGFSCPAPRGSWEPVMAQRKRNGGQKKDKEIFSAGMPAADRELASAGPRIERARPRADHPRSENGRKNG